MKRAVESNHGATPGGATDDLQGVFCGFCATVGEHSADGVVDGNEGAEALHQIDVGLVWGGVECVMGQPCGLIANGFDDARVAMTEVEHADTTDEVDVALALGVPDLGIFAMAEGDGMNHVDRTADAFAAHG